MPLPSGRTRVTARASPPGYVPSASQVAPASRSGPGSQRAHSSPSDPLGAAAQGPAAAEPPNEARSSRSVNSATSASPAPPSFVTYRPVPATYEPSPSSEPPPLDVPNP